MKRSLDQRKKGLQLEPIVRSNQPRKTNQKDLHSPATAKKQTNMFNASGLVVLTNAFDFFFLATKTSDLEITDQDGRNQLHLSALSQDHGNIREILTQFHNQKSKQIRADYILKFKQNNEQKEEEDDIEKIDIYDQLESNNQKKFKKKRVQLLDQETEKQIQDDIRKVFNNYINKKDNYGYSAIQICCFKNDLINQEVDQNQGSIERSQHKNQDPKKQKKQNSESQKEINYKRFLCLQVLIEFGAEINEVNTHTLWAPLHWCAYYADIKSCELLISKGAYQFEHDREGMYPVDLAGIQDNVDNYNILKFLCKKLYNSLTNYQLFLQNNNKALQKAMEKQEEIIVYQEIYKSKGDNLGNALLYTKLLYWLCYICKKAKTQEMIKNLLESQPNIFVQVPLFTLGNNTCLHSIINNRYLDLKEQESQNQNPDQKQDKKNSYSEISRIRTEVLKLLIKHSNCQNIFEQNIPIMNDNLYKQAIQKEIVIDYKYLIDIGPIQLLPQIRYKNNYLREVKNYNKFIRRYNKNVQKFLNDRQYWTFLIEDQKAKDKIKKDKKTEKIKIIEDQIQKQVQVRSSKKELSIQIKSQKVEQNQVQPILVDKIEEHHHHHKHKHHKHHKDKDKDHNDDQQEEKKELIKNDSQISSAKPDKINLKLIVDDDQDVKKQKTVQFEEQQKSSSKIHPFAGKTFTRGLTKKKLQIQEQPQEFQQQSMVQFQSGNNLQENKDHMRKGDKELLEIIEKYCNPNIGMLVGLQKRRLQYLFSDVVMINTKNFYGNTPLHMASLMEDIGMIDILLDCCANMEEENKEFFKAKQLSQRESIIEHYLTFINTHEFTIRHLKSEFKLGVDRIIKRLSRKQGMIKFMITTLKRKVLKIKENRVQQTNDDQQFEENAQRHYHNKMQRKKTINQDLRKFSSELFVPEIVLKFKYNEKKIQKFFYTSVYRIMQKISHQRSESFKQSYGQFIADIPDPQNANPTDPKIVNHTDPKIANPTDPKIVRPTDPLIRNFQEKIQFQITALQKQRFLIYFMESKYEKNEYYIMLRLTENVMEEIAEQMKLQVKLIDSYDLEPFIQKEQQKFEPFRSRQRQQILEYHLKNSIIVDQLKKQKILDIYPMHTSGGLQLIKDAWLSMRPQPFYQILDYLLEGKDQNFGSITAMRLYFGEKISFYFAWKSYLTCALLIIGIPGLALQIFMYVTGDFDNAIIPYWVLLVCIWASFQVEFWKRKTSEINTRWGCIDLMQQEESRAYEGQVRESFSGDEKVFFITRKLTKHYKKQTTYKYGSIFILIFIAFISVSAAITYGLDQLRTQWKGSQYSNLELGALQALSIVFLNWLYSHISYYFVVLENHKFQNQFESSLILKNVSYKFLNSYGPIFYLVLGVDTSLEELFYFLLPLILVKHLAFFIFDVLKPIIIIQYKEKDYFNKMKQNYDNQHNWDKIKALYENYFKAQDTDVQIKDDPIDRHWNYKDYSEKIQSTARVVLRIHEEDQYEKIQEDKVSDLNDKHRQFIQRQQTKRVSMYKSIKNIENQEEKQKKVLEEFLDTDAVELNSFKMEFEGTLDYFMEGMIDFGYYTLFAAAFPIGPILACIVNPIEMRMKLYKLLYLNRRPKSERCAGIGEWIIILNSLSIFSVFSNVILLYIQCKTQTVEIFSYFYEELLTNENLQLWLFLGIVIVLMAIKQGIQSIIPDKPLWVMEEIDKINFKQEQANYKEGKQKLQELKQNIEKNQELLFVTQNKIKSLQNEYEKSQQQKASKIEELNLQLIQHENQQARQQINPELQKKNRPYVRAYNQIIDGLLYLKYIQLERLLLLQRLLQINKAQFSIIMICNGCNKKTAILQCVQCILPSCQNLSYCHNCYFTRNHQENDYVYLYYHPKMLEVFPRQVYSINRGYQLAEGCLDQSFRRTIQEGKQTRLFYKRDYYSYPIVQQVDKLFRTVPQERLEHLYKMFCEFYKPGMLSFSYKFNHQQYFENINPNSGFEIVNESNHNIEDKIFANYIFWPLLTKKKFQMEFTDFLWKCSCLSKNEFHVKLNIVLDAIEDQYNKYYREVKNNDADIIDVKISKEALESMLLVGNLQSPTEHKPIKEMLSEFMKESTLDRNIFLCRYHEENTQRGIFHELMRSLVQNHDEIEIKDSGKSNSARKSATPLLISVESK